MTSARRKWTEKFRINSPVDFAGLIEDVADAVRAGELTQVPPQNLVLPVEEDILNIPPEGPWPDFLELIFENPVTGERYKLAIETYHGSGGTWEKA